METPTDANRPWKSDTVTTLNVRDFHFDIRQSKPKLEKHKASCNTQHDLIVDTGNNLEMPPQGKDQLPYLGKLTHSQNGVLGKLFRRYFHCHVSSQVTASSSVERGCRRPLSASLFTYTPQPHNTALLVGVEVLKRCLQCLRRSLSCNLQALQTLIGQYKPRIGCNSYHWPHTSHIVQVAQLSQRDRAAGWVSNGQKWKAGTERQYLRTL